MEKERLKYCIDRFDAFYDTVNNKSSVFLGLSTFMVGGLIAGYLPIMELIVPTSVFPLLYLSAVGIGLITMIILVFASIPYSGKKSESRYFFGSISSLSADQFYSKSLDCNDEDELIDLRCQVYQLSIGLESKFEKLKWSGWLLTAQFTLLIPIIILILTNLK
ncbi:hypothetical protein GYM62_17755 [Algoriphagus sp. NBT04N3]|jgi:hypothetical protein|uniref:Pycsar system effector family protein n=1 Tax=Algoriphagus sp. NBT04N3 TaxID=2705473 RepID=UPI001C63B6DC|nr:Pycsar system effector family protein [Algoriphagus sp. NBT04N3]QYH40553.1 hypothetical protein GYM62_17755 [Algoriphagus sp. NBT04N3]